MKPKKPKRRTKAEIAREYTSWADKEAVCSFSYDELEVIDVYILAALNAWDRERTRREKAKAKKA